MMLFTMMLRQCHTSASNRIHTSTTIRYFNSNSFVVRRSSIAAVAAVRTTNPQHHSTSIDIIIKCDSCRHPQTCHHHHHHRLHCRYMSSNSSNSVEPDWVRTAIQKMIMDQQQQAESNGETSTAQPPSSSSSTSTASMDRKPFSGVNETNPSPSLSSSIYDNPDLEKSLQSLQNQLREAELCIQDCYECASSSPTTTDQRDMLQKEIDAADHSIDIAVAHFVDLLDAKQQHSSSSNGSKSSTSSSSSLSSTTNHGEDDTHNNVLKAIPTEDLVKRIKHLRSEIAKLKLVQQQSIVTDPKTTD